MKKRRFSFTTATLLAALALGSLSLASRAQPTEPLSDPLTGDPLAVSGFATLAAGRAFGSCVPAAGIAPELANDCVRFLPDYNHGTYYLNRVSFGAESRAGVQVTETLSPVLSATVQLTTHPHEKERLNIEWAYLTWKISPGWTLQVGRKRLPLYYYSEFQDIGYAYTMVRPSPDLYGWDVVNFNGVSLQNTTDLGDWNVRTEALFGYEDSNNNPYARLYYADPIDIRWHDIASLIVEVNHDWLTARVNYTEFKFSQNDEYTGPLLLLNGQYESQEHFLGAALNADLGDWALRTEAGQAQRGAQGYSANYYTANLSYRINKWTPLVQVSHYSESQKNPAYVPNNFGTLSAGLRYEVHRNADLKIQFDRFKDNVVPAQVGNARAVTLTYDLVF